MPLRIKICGLKTLDALDAAIAAGADMAGFVFFAKSPRHLSLDSARHLAAHARGRIEKVALTVDADDDAIASIVDALSPDLIQVHGHESPARLAQIRARFGRPVIKAAGISTRHDLAAAIAAGANADILLFDAKPPENAQIPGGNGMPFDWSLLAGLDLAKPWMLSGGLDPGNVATAIAATGAPGVDVSSGVESAPGVKDAAKIAAFVVNARAARETRAART